MTAKKRKRLLEMIKLFYILIVEELVIQRLVCQNSQYCNLLNKPCQFFKIRHEMVFETEKGEGR